MEARAVAELQGAVVTQVSNTAKTPLVLPRRGGRKKKKPSHNSRTFALEDGLRSAGCCICMETLSHKVASMWGVRPVRRGQVWKRACFHIYHVDCARRNFSRSDACPLCREKVSWLRFGWTSSSQHDQGRACVTTLITERIMAGGANEEQVNLF